MVTTFSKNSSDKAFFGVTPNIFNPGVSFAFYLKNLHYRLIKNNFYPFNSNAITLFVKASKEKLKIVSKCRQIIFEQLSFQMNGQEMMQHFFVLQASRFL